MWKAALILFIAFGAFVIVTMQSATTFDGRNDPCDRVPEACVDPTTGPTTDPTTTTTTTTVATPPTTTPATSAP